MREKLREIRNKEEGFTLVELLAVIVILGIIVAIAIPAVGSVVENSRQSAKEAEVELVRDAARIYFTAEDEDKKNQAVTVSDLRTAGYLDESVGDKNKLNSEGAFTYEAKTGKIKISKALYTDTTDGIGAIEQ